MAVSFAPSRVLYETSTFEHWRFSDGWKVGPSGELSNDWTSPPPPSNLAAYALAPYSPPGQDYAVEAEIRRFGNGNGDVGLGILARGQVDQYMAHTGWRGSGVLGGFFNEGALLATAPDPRNDLGSSPFVVGTDYHLYRLEVRGSELTLYIDGAPVAHATDPTGAKGTEIGLWAANLSAYPTVDAPTNVLGVLAFNGGVPGRQLALSVWLPNTARSEAGPKLLEPVLMCLGWPGGSIGDRTPDGL